MKLFLNQLQNSLTASLIVTDNVTNEAYYFPKGTNGQLFRSTTSGFEFFTADYAGITSTNISNWNTAYGWGNHSTAGYALSSSLSGYVPTSRTITINGVSADLSTDRTWSVSGMIYPGAGIALSTGSSWDTSITNNSANWNTAYSWGNHASAGYQAALSGTGIVKSTAGTITYVTDNSTNWNTAYSWGNHASAGYITGNQSISLSSDVTGTGTTSITTTIATNAVTDAKFRQSAGLSIVGRSANTTGNVADITAASDYHVLRRSGTSIGFGTLNAAALNATYTNGYYLQTDGSGNLSWAAVSGGALSYFTEAQSTASPNNSTYTSSLTASGVATNIDAIIAPKGSGSLLTAVPDSTSTGGNKRGTYSVDLQTSRNAASQVTSGNYSFLAGGQRNTVSGDWSFATGFGNTVSGYSCAAFGESNIVSNGPGFTAGSGNTVSGSYASAIGRGHTASSAYSSVVGGYQNTATASYTTAAGLWSDAYLYGMFANASSRFASTGDSQIAKLHYSIAVTGTAATELFIDGTSIKAILKSGNTVWSGTVKIHAIVSSIGNGSGVVGATFSGIYFVTIKRLGSTTSLVGTVQTITTASDTNMGSSTVAITANDTNEALKITFAPDGATAGSTTVTRVTAAVEFIETRY